MPELGYSDSFERLALVGRGQGLSNRAIRCAEMVRNVGSARSRRFRDVPASAAMRLRGRRNTASRRGDTATATFRDVFAIGEFRALWAAQVLSVVGDQLARVALTLLVFDTTKSAFLAAVTFVASVVPVFFGGIVLAGLADRFPRRRVMIVCDVARCALVVAMIAPRLPLALLV